MLNNAHIRRALPFPIKCQMFQISHLRNIAADGSDYRLDVLVPLSYAEVQLEGLSHPTTKPEAQPSVLTAALPRVALQCQSPCGTVLEIVVTNTQAFLSIVIINTGGCELRSSKSIVKCENRKIHVS